MKRFLITYKNTSIEAPEGEFIIGRSTECHLMLDDPSVSRIHAAIVKEGESLRIEDRDSRNGVTVNKMPVKKEAKLDDGDQIIIGHQIIQIVAAERSRQATKTQGLVRCRNCGTWVSGDERLCSHCGSALEEPLSFDATETRIEADKSGRSPFTTLAELAAKAIQVGKLEEADRLGQSMLASAFSSVKNGAALSDSEIDRISSVLLSLAEAAKAPIQISHLFSIHLASERLMSRELVDQLYDLVRKVGYLACPEMSRYLGFLDSREKTFSPGERFVHKRLAGLVKLCS